MAESGEMLTGEQTVDGKAYLLGEDGTMYTGWIVSKEGKRCYLSSGEAAQGWTVIDAELYYFGDDHLMRTGWLELEDG
jgi:glucan-binding YG repeat protein